MSRKAKENVRNLGGTLQNDIEPYFEGPQLAQARTSISLLERVLQNLLRSEIARLKEDEAELDRFFGHFFDPTAGSEERSRFVTHFRREPPVVVLGYPRTSGEFPCFAVILESEEETDPDLMGDYMGQTLDGEAGEAAEYVGSFFSNSYGIYIYAQNPDVVVYLYQFAKMVIYGAKQALECAGFNDIRFSGGELNPEEMYLPENMFARVLRLSCTAPITIPRLTLDPAKVRLLGLYMDDIVVDGIRGGVTPYDAGDDGNG
jgi:hypothetical protein